MQKCIEFHLPHYEISQSSPHYYLTKLDDFFSLHQISRWNQMKQNLSESFLLHFCTEMSQKSWNFHRQFHFLQCNSIRKMKRNSPWRPPEYLVTLIGFPFHLWKKLFFILQGSCKDSFPFSFLPISYTLWSIDTMGCLHFLNEFKFFYWPRATSERFYN